MVSIRIQEKAILGQVMVADTSIVQAKLKAGN